MMRDSTSYKALLTALQAIPPEKRQWCVERALREIAEDERRGELKKRFDALPTDEMERILASPPPPP
jgi:hypothetical protein